MTEDLKKQIELLRRQIRRHDRLYYVLNAPEITDREYDRLFAELKALEAARPELITPTSPTQRVAGEPVEGFDSVRHTVAMLSVDNTYNADELRAFDERVRKGLGAGDYDYVVELKIDGLAISLRYESGVLTRAVTRGDGQTGDDVTANVRTIKAVPLQLTADDKKAPVPEVLEIRGEVYMPKKAFAMLNELRTDAGDAPFANPRNAAAGSLKLLDAKTTAARNLAFFAYSTGDVSEPIAQEHYDVLQRLGQLSVPVNPHVKKAKDIDEVIEICLGWADKKTQLDYQIDGMVVKVNRIEARDILGATGRAPKWCISYKFPADQAETIVESIDVQVGKTGILTPVVNLKPVQLAGTVVKRASLHNFDIVAQLDVRKGDTVIIEKAGEIIPQVVTNKSKAGKRDSSQQGEFRIPEKCPSCGHDVTITRKERKLTGSDETRTYTTVRCENSNCPSMLKERLAYFVGRNQMDIENFGPALIDQLVDSGLVKNFADIYKLQFAQLAQLDRMGDKSAANIMDGIEKSKDCDLWRLIVAIGILNVGGQTAEILANEFPAIEKLMSAEIETLEAIDQVGPTIAENVYSYFNDPENISIINEMLALGVKPKPPSKKAKTTLTGMTIVVTGTLENFSRQEITQAIKAAGGKTSSSVSAKTSFVLAGANPGSKAGKAETLGIEVIDEKRFLKMLADEG